MQAPPPAQDYQPVPKKKNTWIWFLVGALLICGCGGVILVPAILLPVFLQAKVAATKTTCLRHIKGMALAQIMYSGDYDDRFPRVGDWHDKVLPYVTDHAFQDCPSVRRLGENYGYAMNSALDRKYGSDIESPMTTINLYETSVLTANASGEPAMESPPNRHGRGRSVAYVDGSAKFEKTP